MGRRKLDNGSNGDERNGILAEVPTVETLERRLTDLTEEAARVETLLNCVRGLRGDREVLPLAVES